MKNGRRFFRAMRDAGADGAHEGSINKNLKFDKNRQKVTYGCGIVKRDRNRCEHEKMKIIMGANYG